MKFTKDHFRKQRIVWYHYQFGDINLYIRYEYKTNHYSYRSFSSSTGRVIYTREKFKKLFNKYTKVQQSQLFKVLNKC